MRIIKTGENLRAQSMLEMLSAYAWAILIISLFILVVIALASATSNQATATSTCTISPLLPCEEIVLTNYSSVTGITFYLSFTNDFHNPVLFPTANAFNLTTTGIGVGGTQISYGKCVPYLALAGSTVLCTVSINGGVSPPVGSIATVLFTIAYNLCQGNLQSSCSSLLYKSTGYGSVSIAPANVKFYSVSFISNDVNGLLSSQIDANGIIYMNGVPYASGQNVLLTAPGNYNLYTTLPSGFTFNSWSTNTATSPVAPTNTVVATLDVASNVVVTEIGTTLSCYTCYGFIRAMTCPSTCGLPTSVITYPNGQGSYTCQSSYDACT